MRATEGVPTLRTEAIRLGRVLAGLMPDEPEARGLLALMLIHDARRAARFSGEDLVLLKDQDRSLWDMRQIGEGRALLNEALARRRRGPYVLQAAIASLQVYESPDWPRIAALYDELAHISASPVVELNRAVAVAEAEGPKAALQIVNRLDLEGYQYLHSTRAELLRRLGRTQEARAAYRRALELARAEPERRFLSQRLIEL